MFRFPQPLKGRAARFVSDESVGPTAAPAASMNQNDRGSFPVTWSNTQGVTANEVFTADNQFDQAKHLQHHKSNLGPRITELGPNDVLCGRGSAANNHIGNRKFRDFVKRFEDKYQNSCKADKSFIALQIVLHIQTQTSPPGRFLVKVPASEAGGSDREVYYEIDAIKASKKVSQRLREKKISASAIKESQKKNVEQPDTEEKVSPQSPYSLTTDSVIDTKEKNSFVVVDDEQEADEIVMLESRKISMTTMGYGSNDRPGCEMTALLPPAADLIEADDEQTGELPLAAELIEDVFGDL